MKVLTALFSSVVLGVCLIVLIGFTVKNPTMVEIHYYLGSHWRAPLSFVVLSSFLIGIVSGALLCLKPYIGQRKRILALERELQRLHQPTPR